MFGYNSAVRIMESNEKYGDILDRKWRGEAFLRSLSVGENQSTNKSSDPEILKRNSINVCM
jgi:hypothetical protein